MTILPLSLLAGWGFVTGLGVDPPRSPPAELLAEPASVDLGELRQGDNRPVMFTLKNTGSDPIDIRSTLSDCGCTSARVRKDRIEPNESTVVDAAFLAHRPHGVASAVIQVFGVNSRTGKLSRCMMRVRATVVSDFELSTDSLVFDKSHRCSKQLILTRRSGAKPLEVARAEATHPSFRATVEQNTADQVVVSVTFDPGKWLDDSHVALLNVYRDGGANPIANITLRVAKGDAERSF